MQQFIATMLIVSTLGISGDTTKISKEIEMPPIETVCLEPVNIENVSIWVPAVKSGPFINRSCKPRGNLGLSSTLPASVKHVKKEYCPPQAARLLAEISSAYHSESLPLTIFNGWQWEYLYNLSQYFSATYGLPARGGCWENCWEAVMTISWGQIKPQWLSIESLGKFDARRGDTKTESELAVSTFNSVRIRHGYPKERKL